MSGDYCEITYLCKCIKYFAVSSQKLISSSILTKQAIFKGDRGQTSSNLLNLNLRKGRGRGALKGIVSETSIMMLNLVNINQNLNNLPKSLLI